MFSNFFFLKHIQFLLMALPYPPLGVLLHLLLIPKFLLPTNQICLIQFPISPLVSSSETICPTSALPSQSYNIHLVVAGAKKKAYYKPKVLLAYLTNKEPSFRRLWFMKMAYSSLWWVQCSYEESNMVLGPLPFNRYALGCKWVFILKRNPDTQFPAVKPDWLPRSSINKLAWTSERFSALWLGQLPFEWFLLWL